MSASSAFRIGIEPLPDADEDTQIGNSPFVYGYAGLEPCFVRCVIGSRCFAVLIPPNRGVVHIACATRVPLAVGKLIISFKGVQTLAYTKESGETVKCEKILVHLKETLLENETLHCPCELSLPFQLSLPDAPASQTDLMKSAVRLANLPVQSMHVKGVFSYGSGFESETNYFLLAELVPPSLSPNSLLAVLTAPPVHQARTQVYPFIAHDPRQLPLLLQPDSKRWRSAPGDSPLEYEVELSATTFGPGDALRVQYRLAVARDAAARGVRVNKVTVILREHRTISTTTGNRIPPSYQCSRSSCEVRRWDFYEFGYIQKLQRWRGRIDSEEELNPEDFQFQVDGEENDAEDEPSERLDSHADDDVRSSIGARLFVAKIKTKSAARTSHENVTKSKNAKNTFKVGKVEMAELRPRRKLAAGMSSYTPSHLLPTTAYSYDHVPSSRWNTSVLGEPEFADGWSSGPGGDGLYVENEIEIEIPSTFLCTPDTFKPPPDSSLTFPNFHNHVYQTLPYVEVKHTVQVRVDLEGVEKPIVMECWAVVASVGKKQCGALLEHRIDLMPILDYERVVGKEVWVPAYEKFDSFLGSPGGSENTDDEVEDEVAQFFGELARYIPEGYQMVKFGEKAAGAESSKTVSPSRDNLGEKSTTSLNECNYFQERPSISSLLTISKPSSGGRTGKPQQIAIDVDSPLLKDGLDVELCKTPSKESPPISQPAERKFRRMSINTRVQQFKAVPRLMSAHSLLESDASRVATVGSPTSEQLVAGFRSNRRKDSALSATMTRLGGSSGSIGRTNAIWTAEELTESDSDSGEDGFVRHPLLDDFDIEARRRAKIARRLARKADDSGGSFLGVDDNIEGHKGLGLHLDEMSNADGVTYGDYNAVLPGLGPENSVNAS
ncbi:hypothetical protein HDU83_000920 [Entophlyctis luteolus]|nr:hypothetical protein HDU83_000920 [Entophlyctis luteolus]